ncbi:MAG: hypothetical protein M1436_03550 [Acidobacteria bacterium]|nr:hypothetical protein [Acidobacteriota bacterium]
MDQKLYTQEELHLFFGSGVIETGCKTVIGSRLKQSGMFAAPPDFHFYIAHPCAGAFRADQGAADIGLCISGIL